MLLTILMNKITPWKIVFATVFPLLVILFSLYTLFCRSFMLPGESFKRERWNGHHHLVSRHPISPQSRNTKDDESWNSRLFEERNTHENEPTHQNVGLNNTLADEGYQISEDNSSTSSTSQHIVQSDDVYKIAASRAGKGPVVKGEKPKHRFPQCLVIGFAKCGTRALLDALSLHPYVLSAGPEMHFYDQQKNFDRGYQWYRQQMPLSYR